MYFISFVLEDHFSLAVMAALMFSGGIALGYFVVRQDHKWLIWMPLFLFQLVRKLIGDHPSMIRLSVVIFSFNTTAIALYMSSGFHPFVPALIALITGCNIMVILLMMGKAMEKDVMDMSPKALWAPGPVVTNFCGLAVLFLELPSFWYAIAMGISLGQEVLAGDVGYTQGLTVRLQAYAMVIVPALFVSALCETIAIQGLSRLSGQDGQ